LEAQNAALEAQNAALEAQNAALEAQNAALEAQNAALKAQNSALEAQKVAEWHHFDGDPGPHQRENSDRDGIKVKSWICKLHGFASVLRIRSTC
jgi:hypothetical protein